MRKRRRIIKSGFEGRAKQMFKDHGIKAAYEEDKIKYDIPKNYVPDFKIGTVYIETKGFFDVEARQKMKHVKRCNPDLDIRIWFQADKYLTKRKNKKYSDWARQHGYPYHIGEEFPIHWFNEKGTK